MIIEKILEQINEGCKLCIECDPCCTGNILKKCIEKKLYRIVNDKWLNQISINQSA